MVYVLAIAGALSNALTTILQRMGVDGLIVTPELERYETGGLRHGS